MRLRALPLVRLLPLLLAALAACSQNPPPALPQAPPDVQGRVSSIRGSFAGGGTVSVRPEAAAGAPEARLELAPGVPILERREGRLRWANLSKLGVGDRVTAWWDGPPVQASGPREGAARILVIERT